MNAVRNRRQLADNIVQLEVEAPRIARRRKPGQFVIVRVRDGGERIPLTIADADASVGTITLVVQVVGKTTGLLAELDVGEAIADVAGPLGRPTHIENVGTVAAVAGGIGVAPLFPIAQALKEAGNRVLGVLGARSASLVVWEDRLRSVSDRFIVTTDDGSYGRPGRVTEALSDLLMEEKVGQVVAIGPPIMMKAVAELTRPLGIPTLVSLNPIMVDGTGMCGGCRGLVGGQNRFVCVDGPEFDGHQVDFDNMMARLSAYREYEAVSLQAAAAHRFGEEGCRLAEEARRAREQ
ncbi:MAG: sulfide/dihydroorotate dehydrogenase-like FAD/NAD-binding protein [Fimbriimonadales bacterium]|nr:sulfide/dihydroorotate dehydrogenase-like FAD/NAD-binding protein [Fimbriimonadales bacterium]